MLVTLMGLLMRKVSDNDGSVDEKISDNHGGVDAECDSDNDASVDEENQ